MTLEITEHSAAAWQRFAEAAQFVPDPMIIRAGEVFANGVKGAQTLNRQDMDVQAAIRDNIAGLIEFFDLLVTYERIPLINYEYTFDQESLPAQITTLLGPKVLPIMIRSKAYEAIKIGALESLATFDLNRVIQFGHLLGELDSLRYDWRPDLEPFRAKGWLARAAELDDSTRRSAQFLLGGLIFSGFAQASLIDHIVQPKRSRFFLALTTEMPLSGGVPHAAEDAVFATAEAALQGTVAEIRRLDALPPVLPYLLSKAPPTVTSGDLLKLALDFTNTKDGERFRKAVAVIRGDGMKASQTADLAKAAKAEALALLEPYSTLADKQGGLKVEAKWGAGGPSGSLSGTLTLPAWLKVWWNEYAPFGSLRKTFRRMWLADKSYQDLEKALMRAWTQT